MAVPEILEKWSSITYYASSPYRYNLMLFLKVMNITFLKVKNITSVLSSGGTRNFGGIEGQNAILRGKNPKICRKWLILDIFSSDGGGGVGAEPLTGGNAPYANPWCRHWFFRDFSHGQMKKKIILSIIFAGLCFKRCKMATHHSLQQLQLQNKI